MEKENHYQLELFSQEKSPGSSKKHFSNYFLTFIRAYEKAILITIGLLATGVFSFSLGVEKGKRITLLNANSRLDIALKKEKASPEPVIIKQEYEPAPDTQAIAKRKEQKQAPQKNELKEYIQNYTIQIASYRTKANAQEEARALKKKGLSSFVLPKGKFSIVCVGNFLKQESARTLLAQLKKRYRDCYVRRL